MAIATTQRTITINDVGPIHALEIPLPSQGGVVVLYGRNGKGKSKALEAVDSLVSGRGKIEARDGAKSGQVDGFGARLTVARSTRRTGQAEVITLEGRLNVADLVDPKIKDPAAADAQRIKALVQLASVEASAARFAALVGGMNALRGMVPAEDLDTEDPVTMAGRIKRRIEAEARKIEAQAEHAGQKAATLAGQAEGVDLAAMSDSQKLGAELERRIATESALRQKAIARRQAIDEAQAARSRLMQAEATYTGPTTEQAKASESEAEAGLRGTQRLVDSLRESLRQAEEKANLARQNLAHAIAARKQAEAHEASMTEWREQVTLAEAVVPIPDEDLQAASVAVQDARQAVERGVLVRKAKEAMQQAEASKSEQRAHEARAAELREAARGTDQVLSDAVGQSCSRLRVEAGRLVLDTQRGVTYYGDLSHGERWRIALDIAIDALPAGGVLTLPQEAWESLDPVNRQQIAEHIAGRGAVLITAQASEDERIVADRY